MGTLVDQVSLGAETVIRPMYSILLERTSSICNEGAMAAAPTWPLIPLPSVYMDRVVRCMMFGVSCDFAIDWKRLYMHNSHPPCEKKANEIPEKIPSSQRSGILADGLSTVFVQYIRTSFVSLQWCGPMSISLFPRRGVLGNDERRR